MRARIVSAAARAVREDGLTSTSIPALMKEVGLTHGSFYVYFDSRDELVSEAVRAAAEGTAARVLAPDDTGLQGVVDRYLSEEHVRNPGFGCVVAALGTEGARQPLPVRATFAEVAVGFLQRVEEAASPLAPGDATTLDDATLVRAASMVGAVLLARLVDDPALAARILEANRQL